MWLLVRGQRGLSAGSGFVILLLATATAAAAAAAEQQDRPRAVAESADEAGGSPRPVAVVDGSKELVAKDAPAESLTTVDEAWLAVKQPLVRRAKAAAAADLAELIDTWNVPAVPPTDGRQVIYRIPSQQEAPAWLATAGEASQRLWADFLEARRERADVVFDLAREAASEERGCEALRLLAVALMADPDHARGREAGGWVRRVDDGVPRWYNAAAAARIARREVFLADHGWLPRAWQDRYTQGFRRQGSRWVPADELKPATKLADAPVWQSDHWRISHLGDEASAARLATLLEETSEVWWQAFGSFAFDRDQLPRRFLGKLSAKPRPAMQAVLFADRSQYVETLERLEPQIARTLGIYWMPSRVAYFFTADDQLPATIHHEATHQLFAESRRTSPLAGERCGFWVLEAVACYMESLEAFEQGWRLGGLEHGRAPMAVERLTLDGFFVPLEMLCGLSRVDFQAHPQLPQLYSQISGLADFFINGQQGRYREAFVRYIEQVATGAAGPDSLARLCEAPYADLDEEYRRHVSR